MIKEELESICSHIENELKMGNEIKNIGDVLAELDISKENKLYDFFEDFVVDNLQILRKYQEHETPKKPSVFKPKEWEQINWDRVGKAIFYKKGVLRCDL